MIIHIHIPKCAGTTFVDYLCDVFGPQHVFESVKMFDGETETVRSIDTKNSQEPSPVPIPSTIKSSVKEHALNNPLGRRIFQSYYAKRQKSKEISDEARMDCITGHFTCMDMIQEYPKASFIVLLREPVQRLISLYHYWNRDTLAADDWFHEEQPTMEEFILDKRFHNSISTYIEPFKIEDFACVGIVEKYDQSILKCNELFKSMNIPLPHMKQLEHKNKNPNASNDTYTVSEDVMKKARKLHGKDYALYEEALTSF